MQLGGSAVKVSGTFFSISLSRDIAQSSMNTYNSILHITALYVYCVLPSWGQCWTP